MERDGAHVASDAKDEPAAAASSDVSDVDFDTIPTHINDWSAEPMEQSVTMEDDDSHTGVAHWEAIRAAWRTPTPEGTTEPQARAPQRAVRALVNSEPVTSLDEVGPSEASPGVPLSQLVSALSVEWAKGL